jgi:hypothetical protein
MQDLVAYQLIGKRALAEHAFHLAIYLDPTWNCTLHRLSMEREKRTQEMTELVPLLSKTNCQLFLFYFQERKTQF